MLVGQTSPLLTDLSHSDRLRLEEELTRRTLTEAQNGCMIPRVLICTEMGVGVKFPIGRSAPHHFFEVPGALLGATRKYGSESNFL